MYQIDNSTAAATQQAATAAGTPGFFTDGNPAGGLAATIVPAEWLNAVQQEIINALVAAGITPTKSAYNQLALAMQGITQSGVSNYGVDTGTANVYAVAFAPAVTAIADGLKLRFRAKTANTGGSTFSPNGIAAQPIIGGAHAALQGGELIANSDVEVVWNSSLAAWILLEQTGGAPQVPLATQSKQAAQVSQTVGRLLNIQTFSTVGTFTYTPTPGTKTIIAEGVGGGGSGGGSPACTSTQATGGAGGGSGAYFKTMLTSAFAGLSVIVGAGGVGASGVAGSSGGATSFGTASAPGGGFGSPGGAGSLFPQIVGYGAGGAVSTGANIINAAGGFGMSAFALGATSAISGSGGSSIFGGGGSAKINASIAGNPGVTPGSGGSGALTLGSGSAQVGGNGAPGEVVIYEYA